MEANLLGDASSLFVKAVAQTVNHALDQHLTGGGKGNPQNYIPLDAEGARFAAFGFAFSIITS